MRTADIAWTAGFLEGEGCFTHTRSTPLITVSQVQREPLERLERMFGGRLIEIRARSRVSAHWRWTLYGQRAIEVMMTVFVLLSPRRKEQAKAAIDVWKFRFASGAACGKGGRFRTRTHCTRGHEYTSENTRTKHGHRYCRSCTKERNRRAWTRSKERRALEGES